MVQHRYSKWDGSQEPFPVDATDLFRELQDHLLETGDIREALQNLLRRGMRTGSGRKVVGAEELRRRVLKRRRELLRRNHLGQIFDELNRELDSILDLERHTLAQQQADAESILGRGAINELRRRMAGDAPPPGGVGERMWYDAVQRERKLDVLPETFHGRLTELRRYDFANPEAQEQFDALVAGLQQRMLGHYFRDVRDTLQQLSPRDQQHLKEMLRDLSDLLRRHLAGEDVEQAFADFKEQYPHLVRTDPEMSFAQFLEMLTEQAAQLQALLSSLGPDDMAQLEQLLDWSFLDDDLHAAMREFTELMYQLAPPEQAVGYGFEGQHPLSLDEALQTVDQLHKLDQLELRLDRALWRGHFDDIERELARDALGAEGARMLEDLQRMATMLEEAKYLRRTPDGWALTHKAVRRLGVNALKEIFARAEDTVQGRHLGRAGREAGTPTGEARPWRFGDQMDVDVPRTIFNALHRHPAGAPVDIAADDIAIRELEYQARCATVLLIDQSSSMGRLGRFAAAKRVVLALHELIRQRYPRDELYVVGFHTLGQPVPLAELATLREMPRQGAIWINEAIPLAEVRRSPEYVPMDFTNVQEGLRIARTLLGRTRARTKQVIMITDGQPTAFLTRSHLVLSYPEVEDPIAAALKEARRCTRHAIRINTFMLRQDYYLEAFVQRLTEINRGRAFFTTPADLGTALMQDFVRGRTSRV